MERYQFTLSADILAKAVNELHEPEDNANRLAAIDALRSTFKAKYPKIKLSREDDKFFLKFLRARKFKKDEAINLLLNYHSQKPTWPDFFHRLDNPKLLEHAVAAGVVWPLRGKAKDGSAIVVTRFGKGNTTILDGFALVYLAFEKLLEYEENQINGFVVIHDLAHAGPKLAIQIKPQTTKKIMNILDNALPCRMKKVYFTNQPSIFGAIFTLFNTMMTKKMKEKTIICGNNYDILNETVDKMSLPKLFLGSGPEYDITRVKSEILGRKSVDPSISSTSARTVA